MGGAGGGRDSKEPRECCLCGGVVPYLADGFYRFARVSHTVPQNHTRALFQCQVLSLETELSVGAMYLLAETG